MKTKSWDFICLARLDPVRHVTSGVVFGEKMLHRLFTACWNLGSNKEEHERIQVIQNLDSEEEKMERGGTHKRRCTWCIKLGDEDADDNDSAVIGRLQLSHTIVHDTFIATHLLGRKRVYCWSFWDVKYCLIHFVKVGIDKAKHRCLGPSMVVDMKSHPLLFLSFSLFTATSKTIELFGESGRPARAIRVHRALVRSFSINVELRCDTYFLEGHPGPYGRTIDLLPTGMGLKPTTLQDHLPERL